MPRHVLFLRLAYQAGMCLLALVAVTLTAIDLTTEAAEWEDRPLTVGVLLHTPCRFLLAGHRKSAGLRLRFSLSSFTLIVCF